MNAKKIVSSPSREHISILMIKPAEAIIRREFSSPSGEHISIPDYLKGMSEFYAFSSPSGEHISILVTERLQRIRQFQFSSPSGEHISILGMKTQKRAKDGVFVSFRRAYIYSSIH